MAAAKTAKKTTRKANAHLSLENLNSLCNGGSVVVNLADDNLELTLTSETIKDEIDTMMERVSNNASKMFSDVDRSFKRIFGKKK